ncbi:MAG: DNA pilot protein [Microvirus sp.]|nr:MAG: DNA pilot protein [Microvirus sp.]
MPLPFAAVAPLIGSGINALSQIFTNQSQRSSNLEIYDKQRTDALSDWNKQNQYNSPKEQMARFKEAGLNPHLIYGQTNTASPVRSVSADSPKYVAPQINPETLNTSKIAQEMGLLTAQTANIQAQNSLRETELKQREIDLQFKTDTFETRVGGEFWKTNQYKNLADKTQFETYARSRELQPRINQMIANTNLSVANKAKAVQIITNLKTTERLLQKKIVTEDFVQQAYYGRVGLLSENKLTASTQRDIAYKILELKQLGLSLDAINSIISLSKPASKGITINK